MPTECWINGDRLRQADRQTDGQARLSWKDKLPALEDTRCRTQWLGRWPQTLQTGLIIIFGRESGPSMALRGFGVPIPILEPGYLLLTGPQRRVAVGSAAEGAAGKWQWAGDRGRGHFNGIQG